jgi:methyl-accepting chemotaxis protein
VPIFSIPEKIAEQVLGGAVNKLVDRALASMVLIDDTVVEARQTIKIIRDRVESGEVTRTMQHTEQTVENLLAVSEQLKAAVLSVARLVHASTPGTRSDK